MRVRVTYGIIITMMLTMNLIMVAEGMPGADPSTPGSGSGAGSGSSGSGMTNTMTIGKVFGTHEMFQCRRYVLRAIAANRIRF